MLSQITLLVFNLVLINYAYGYLHLELDTQRNAFDPRIYEEALDPVLCQEQLSYIRNNTQLMLQFLDAGLRLPRAILMGNTRDMGNYIQCLGIEEEVHNSVLEGKYCTISGPVDNNFKTFAKSMNWIRSDAELYMSEETMKKQERFNAMKTQLISVINPESERKRNMDIVPVGDTHLTLAICVPKTCTSEEGMRGLLFDLDTLDIRFEEQFCRLKNDKPWVAGDYVGIIFFSLIGLLTILSTSYDVWHQIVAGNDPKTASLLCRSFSVFTNTRRLLTFTSNPGTLECVDGVRSLAMMWVIVGHAYTTFPPTYNNIDMMSWVFDFRSLWISAAPYTVDTFFMMTGMLLVYTTAGKMNGMRLLKNLHMFYLNRLLRMFPLLATAILLQVSIFHRAVDGPLWTTVAEQTNVCRTYWWSTLLYVQNYFNPTNICLAHTWYLAVDMQLYVISPLVLFWVLSGKRNQAWNALAAGVLVALVIGTTYSVVNQFQGWLLAPSRGGSNYAIYYYFNTLTRASPFFVGMIFGYLLHIWKGKKVGIPFYISLLLWVCALTITSLNMYVTHEMKDFANWNNPVVDDLVNSLSRPMWAMAVGWIIFACQNGLAGPVNWFLSLGVWKLPSRLSYGMYLFHFPILFVASNMKLQPRYFVEVDMFFGALGQIAIAFAVSFVLTVLIDSPFTVLFKMLFGEGPKKTAKEVLDK